MGCFSVTIIITCLAVWQKKEKNMWTRAPLLGICQYQYTFTLYCFYKIMQKDSILDHEPSSSAERSFDFVRFQFDLLLQIQHRNSSCLILFDAVHIKHPSIHFLYPLNPIQGNRGEWSISQLLLDEKWGTPSCPLQRQTRQKPCTLLGSIKTHQLT